ncbi:MAG: phosphatase PAP2 family protein [Ferruginibacter sp.]
MKQLPVLIWRTAKKLFANFGVLLLVFIACLWILLALADMIFEDNNTRFDETVFASIAPYYNSKLSNFFEFITFFGSHYFLLPANLLLVIIFISEKKIRFYGWKIAVISSTGIAVMFWLKEMLERQRPIVPLISQAHGYSFPSGHSFSSFLFFGMTGYIVYKKVQHKALKWLLIIFLAFFTLLIGFSRIYLKVHFATDVLAGFLLAAIWLTLAKWLLIDRRKKLPPGNETLIG